jgi:hypothetical protein
VLPLEGAESSILAISPAAGVLCVLVYSWKFVLKEIFRAVAGTMCGTSPSLQIFTLEINRKPTLFLRPKGIAETCEICLDAGPRIDLSALTSDGVRICTKEATLVPRPALQTEIAAFKRAVELAPTSDEPTMAFLVKIDGVMVVTVDPE